MAQQPTNERIEQLRGQARRARRLAATVSGDADRLRLFSHAEELEETAAQLEGSPQKTGGARLTPRCTVPGFAGKLRGWIDSKAEASL
jgi:hypothetical protein